MKKIELSTAAIAFFAVILSAAGDWPLTNFRWITGCGTASTNEIYVAAVVTPQFKSYDTNVQWVVGIMPDSYRDTLNSNQLQAVENAFEALTNGSFYVTATNLASLWLTNLTEEGIAANLVLPGSTPAISNEFYGLLLGSDEDAMRRFAEFDLTICPEE